MIEPDQIPVGFDPYDPAMHDDPYPAYRALRDHAPAYFNAGLGFWALSRYEDVQGAARDWSVFSSAESVDIDETPRSLGLNSFIDLDPPRHDVLRRLVREHFTPRAITGHEPMVASIVDNLLDRLEGRPDVDMARDFAFHVPLTVVRQLLGFPDADQERLDQWFHELVYRDLYPGIPARARAAATAMRAYFEEQADRERRTPRGTILSSIVAGVESGAINTRELGDMCFLLFLAGYETTASAITNSLLLLAEHPEERTQLVADPGLIPRAIEELLRYQSPVQFLGRTAHQDVAMHGQVIHRGERVLLLYGSANRDERKFPNPDSLIVTREPTRHFAFGEGIHFCLGAPLARIELKAVLQSILTRYPSYRLAGRPVRFRRLTTYGLSALPIQL